MACVDPPKGIDVTVTIQVSIVRNPPMEEFYDISYNIKNNSGKALELDFMHNIDTQLGNVGDQSGYYTGGSLQTQQKVYDGPDIPPQIAIWSPSSTYDFVAQVRQDAGNPPDKFGIGNFDKVDDWEYYDGTSTLHGNISSGASQAGYSMVWLGKPLADGATQSFGLDFGISDAATNADIGAEPAPTPTPPPPAQEAFPDRKVWIQSGDDTGDGFYIFCCDAGKEELGLDEVLIDPIGEAAKSLGKIKSAIQQVINFRTRFDTDQRRLESAEHNILSMVENTTAANSRIRDTDMAQQMTRFTMQNIVQQSAQAMLAQANQQPQSVLQLLQ